MSARGDSRSVWPAAVLGALLILSAGNLARAQTPEEIFDRAVADFSAGRVEEAADECDQVARARPGAAPQLWQRGIALYYAGRYQDCRRQFESHLTVNPSDVENSAWHFLCVARAESPEAARRARLPVGPDPRRPMREIYEMAIEEGVKGVTVYRDGCREMQPMALKDSGKESASTEFFIIADIIRTR